MSAVFVLGGGSTIAGVLARELAAGGTPVALCARRPDAVAALADELGASVHPLEGDVFEGVDAAVDAAAEVHGGLSGVVNCAGSLLLKPAHHTTPSEWRETIAANLDTAFAAVRSGARAMYRTGGSIVLVSSAAAQVGLMNHEAIAAAKAGVEGLVRSAAATYAPRALRVNAVAPGLVRTRLSAELLRSDVSEQASISMHALARLGEPEDVSRAIAWLLSPAQSWISGQVLGVDGGLARLRPRVKA